VNVLACAWGFVRLGAARRAGSLHLRRANGVKRSLATDPRACIRGLDVTGSTRTSWEHARLRTGRLCQSLQYTTHTSTHCRYLYGVVLVTTRRDRVYTSGSRILWFRRAASCNIIVM